VIRTGGALRGLQPVCGGLPGRLYFIAESRTEDGRWYPEFFRINFSRCIFCGMCEEACPTTAIQLTPDFEMAEFNRQNLVYEKEHLLISGPGKYPITTSTASPAWPLPASPKARPKTKRNRSTSRACCPEEHLWNLLSTVAALVAILATLRVITNANPVHALLNLIISLLAVAMIFFMPWRTFCRRAGNHRVCRRHHGAVRVRGDDAESGASNRAARIAVAAAVCMDCAGHLVTGAAVAVGQRPCQQ
jgi:ferredoxin